MSFPTQLHHQRPPWYDSFRFSTPFSAVPASSKWWHRLRCGFIIPGSHDHPSWWSRAWRKLRAWSSMVVTSPMWKKFIRPFRGDRHINYVNHFNDFHYNPSDYEMNFDDGPGQNRYFDEDGSGRDFLSRFA